MDIGKIVREIEVVPEHTPDQTRPLEPTPTREPEPVHEPAP
jgi:hypothetical protein